MRFFMLPGLLVLLSACDSPSLAFRDVPATRMEVDGSVFSVRIKEDRAEAMRTSREWLPGKSAILARGAKAIRLASGCAVDEVGGDQAIVTARLDCKDT